MKEASKRFPPLTSQGTANATSLLALADGASHSGLPVCQTRRVCGQEAARASHSASEATPGRMKTSVICGQSFSGSSRSNVLSAYLASKLQQTSVGSTWCKTIWSLKATPSGRPLYQARSQAHFTQGSDYISWAPWPTPTSRDHKDGAAPSVRLSGRKDKLPHAVHLLERGATLSQPDAETACKEQLNPALPRWLMGYPPEWDVCAAMATPSSRKLLPSS